SGLPRRGAPQGAAAGDQPQHNRAKARPQGQGVRSDVGPNGRPGGLPQRRPGQAGPGAPPQGQPQLGQQQPGRPGQPQQGQPQPGQQQAGRPQPGQGAPQGRPQPAPAARPQAPAADRQGPPTLQQPVIGQGAPEPAPVESTQSFARPAFEASQIDPRDPLGLGLVEPVLPSVANPAPRQGGYPEQQPAQPPVAQQSAPQQALPQQQPMALPPRRSPEHGATPGTPGDGQQGFRSGGASRMASVQVNQPAADGSDPEGRQAYQPQRPGTSAPGFDQQPGRQQQPGQQGQQQGQPQPGRQQFGGQGGQPGEAPWRPSANDERWRRAEQVRVPSSDGVTLSGLPRRTPQANLVAGTAEAAPLTGPQVSRAPEEVRGRLTNLRRGIQQGRRAGAEATQGIPVSGQQFDGFGRPAGADQAQGGYRSAAPDPFGDGGRGGHGFGTENQER
ncbi:hypothetical protein ACQRUO_39400, partial [Kitasatospora sp. LaBMicrA B282]